MTRLRGAYSLILALAAGSMACGMNPPVTDAAAEMGVVTDTPIVTDTPPATDAGDVPVVRDGGDGSTGDGGVTCNMVAIENLNTLGMLTGDTTRLASDNRAATSTSTTSGIQPSASLQSSGLCAYRVGHQRVFSYTVRGNSVLRLSTTNMGTDPGFDTTLTVLANMCPRANAMFLGCNDDDLSFGGADRRISSTVVTARQVMAGATVYIGLGGFVPVTGTRNEMREIGNFVLTVQEIPVVADGMACDRRRQTTACGDTSSCVPATWPSDSGFCRANGTVAGAACDASGACSGTGLTCNAGANVCTATVADGMPCDIAGHVCGMTSTCVTPVLGASYGTCRPNGSGLTPCTAAGTCDTGFTCRTTGATSFCLRTIAAGGACSTFDSACPTGQSCVQTAPNGTAGTCTADGTAAGTACTAAGTCTGTGLACTMVGTNTQCTRTVAAGAACVGSDICDAATATCYLTDLTVPFRGTCFTMGAANGACATSGACPAPQMCSDTVMPANGRCVATVAVGAACTLTNQCPMNSFCVPAGSGAFMGTCQMNGAVGTPCLATGAACTGTATCSSFIPEEGRCQAPATGACDVRYQSDRCATGQVCKASFMAVGACSAPTMETEPNDAPSATLTAITASTAITGSMSQFDVDCFALTVPANGQIYARLNTPAGTCLTEVNVDIYQDAAPGNARFLGSSTGRGLYGCANIDGSDALNYSWARNLPAGRYYACVRDNPIAPRTIRVAVPAYVLSLNAQ